MGTEKHEIIGTAYDTLKKLVKAYAIKDKPILLYGESGTGKELFAKLFMKESPRKGNKVTVNCASLSEDLLRSEIFGHIEGAFTGANRKRDGKLQKCKDGILFLDELGDASKEFQAAILRVAEGYSFSPVGSDDEIKNVHTLIMAATLKPDQIREDLKARFHLLPVPPLQKTDIPIIVKTFLDGRILKQEILNDLLKREYPSNVRSLKKYCERLLVEKGDSIFSANEIKYAPHKSIGFDYERYRRELETWHKYIQPLIFESKTFRYKYMAWDYAIMKDQVGYNIGNSIGRAYILTHGYKRCRPYLLMSDTAEAECKKLYSQSMVELIEMLQVDATYERTQKFLSYLKIYFDDGTLPYLLDVLYKTEKDIEDEPVRIYPAMSSLLNLPLDKAKAEFNEQYAEYNLNRYKSNEKELKQATGKNKVSLQQIIRRAKAPK
ncbi:MAG TPA: sigma 54-interacting transcriptional regulator [Smithellaceae bacterium]|nr:sigma 54-interacting transcriptional regulator [Smithellaceae bacterium]